MGFVQGGYSADPRLGLQLGIIISFTINTNLAFRLLVSREMHRLYMQTCLAAYIQGTGKWGTFTAFGGIESSLNAGSYLAS